MTPVKKKIAIILTAVISAYFLFVAADCVRLMSADKETKPFVTVSMAQYEDGNGYVGLGYSVRYRDRVTADPDDTNDICGAEFRLFGKILVWAWIE